MMGLAQSWKKSTILSLNHSPISEEDRVIKVVFSNQLLGHHTRGVITKSFFSYHCFYWELGFGDIHA